MNLTKNEKKVLKMLLENSRITDSGIAKKLKITSQAVGKIRRKLERTIIKSYSIEVDYSQLGINVFAASLAKLTEEGIAKGELEVEQILLKCPNMIQVYRLPNQSTTHMIIYGFEDMEDLDKFFHSREKNNISKYIKNKDLFTFSGHSRIKNDAKEILNIAIENIGSERPSKRFREIEKFKTRLK